MGAPASPATCAINRACAKASTRHGRKPALQAPRGCPSASHTLSHTMWQQRCECLQFKGILKACRSTLGHAASRCNATKATTFGAAKKEKRRARGLSQHERWQRSGEKGAQNWREGAWLPCQRRQGAGQALQKGAHACASCMWGLGSHRGASRPGGTAGALEHAKRAPGERGGREGRRKKQAGKGCARTAGWGKLVECGDKAANTEGAWGAAGRIRVQKGGTISKRGMSSGGDVGRGRRASNARVAR